MIVGLMSIAGRGERVPSPGWSLLAALCAWCAWDAASYFWSVNPAYTAGELRREVAYGV